MDKILRINGKSGVMQFVVRVLNCVTEADGDLVCQAGARWEDINQVLKDKGIPLFFPVSWYSA